VQQTIYSNGSSPFTGLAGCLAINSNKTIAFEGDLKTGGGGIFTTNGGSINPAIVNGPLVPYPWPSVNDAGTVGVLAIHTPGGSVGIFTGPDPVADKVIETGDILFGSVVQQLAFFRGINNHGQIAFLARLADGTIGVYRADPVIRVGIEIKPGSSRSPINPKSRGKIPVAILSTADFNAPLRVNVSSVTFGHTGDEPSLAFCNSTSQDVNGDGLPDLLCHFNTERTDFRSGDTEGILKGKTTEGTPIIARDTVRIVPF
jgi:hypothetical protein